jgi:phosphoribosylformylglycinamidine (FGAM) synthase-like amidotransferase family enzyme
MSRSKRKFPVGAFCNAGSMKLWRRSVNKRLRHNCKQKLNTCRDWDSLILPVIDEDGNMYDSPKDGRYHIKEKPDDDECFRDNQVGWLYSSYKGKWYERYPLNEQGHHDSCNCISNKNGWYWKSFRK